LEERRNALARGCFGKAKGNKLLKKIGFKWKNNIEINIEEVDCKNLD
jgi:hypothetical protein